MKSARTFRRFFLSLVVLVASAPAVASAASQNTIEIQDYNFDFEQVLDSQGRADSVGKEKFNPFQVTRKSDQASPRLLQAAVTGEAFQIVVLDTMRHGKRVKVVLHDVTISGYQRTGETERLTLHSAYGQIDD